MDVVNWGVIGCGGIADRRTIPEGILPARNARLGAVMDADPQRAEAVANRWGLEKAARSLEELLANETIQAVYIATPNALHYGQVLAAARAGKHVLVEKPIALKLDDAQEMITTCRTEGVYLAAGYMMRFHALHRALAEIIANGGLGQPVYARAQLTCWYPPIPGAWRQDPVAGGGGAWMDLGSHCIDLLEFFFGPISRVAAFSRTLTHSYAVDDSTTVLCEFENGAQGVVETNFNVPDDAAQNSLEVRGTRGVVISDHTIGQGPGGQMTAFLADQAGYDAAQDRLAPNSAQPVLATPVNPYQGEIEEFSDAILKRREPALNGEHALRNLRLVLAAYEAARTGKVIEV